MGVVRALSVSEPAPACVPADSASESFPVGPEGVCGTGGSPGAVSTGGFKGGVTVWITGRVGGGATTGVAPGKGGAGATVWARLGTPRLASDAAWAVPAFCALSWSVFCAGAWAPVAIARAAVPSRTRWVCGS
jgi:hypothetical protein